MIRTAIRTRPSAGARAVGQAALVAAVAAALFAWIQTATPHIVDRDGYYHARYANLLPARGLDRTFPWAQETVLRDQFSDTAFLFHVLLAPLCAAERDMVPGAKAAAVAFGAALAAAVYLLLRAHGVRGAAFFALALFASGNHFLFRMSMARPHLLSVLLAVVGAHAILADRRRLLAAVGFVYAWSYAAPYLLVGLAAADAVARRRLGPLGAASAGVGAGLVLHPYFPNDLYVLWVQSAVVLGRAWGLAGGDGPRLGAEFDPVTTRSLLFTSTGAAAALAFGIAAGLFGRERPSPRTRSLAAMAAATLLLFLLSAKFVEYFAPFAVLFAASAASDLAGDRPLRDLLGGPRRRAAARIAAAAALVLLCGGLAARAVALARQAVAATPLPALEGAARFLRAHAPPGETVVHLGWSEFAVLFHFAPEHRYLVAFDPMFMWARDPERGRLLEDVRAGRRPIDPEELRRVFGGRWLAISKERPRQTAAARAAGLEPVYEDATGALFSLEAGD